MHKIHVVQIALDPIIPRPQPYFLKIATSVHDPSFRSQFVHRIRPEDQGTDICGAHE